MSLHGKNALVTGGSRGIGRGIALALAAQGCTIALGYMRKRAAAEAVAAEISDLGGRAVVLRANLSSETEARRLAEAAAQELGGIDIFVANAAGGVSKPLAGVKSNDWDWTVNINARSILAGVQVILPHMQSRRWGRILTISSSGSSRVVPNYGMVGVSKAALEAMTRYLAVELAPHGIIANCISPGLVDTGAIDAYAGRDETLARVASHTPAGRLATPADVGSLAAWLCTDQASMIVGQTIEIDGGYGLLMFG